MMSDQPNNNSTEKLLARQRKADALDRRLRRAAEDVSIYLTGGKRNAGTCLVVAVSRSDPLRLADKENFHCPGEQRRDPLSEADGIR